MVHRVVSVDVDRRGRGGAGGFLRVVYGACNVDPDMRRLGRRFFCGGREGRHFLDSAPVGLPDHGRDVFLWRDCSLGGLLL